MELLNVLRARSSWLLDINDLNPRGKSIAEKLIDWLVSTYNFSKKPSSPTDLDETKALAFIGGMYQIRDEIFIDTDLRIYNDGFVADTRSSTEDTDAFLKDALEMFSKEFALPYRPDMIRRRLYHSELTVRTSQALYTLNPKLGRIIQKLSQHDGYANLDLAGIAFWSDSMPIGVIPFRFERKLGASFSENRYYSAASLSTSDHFSVLQELENILHE